MRIRVLPRKFFERIRGTPEEETVLNACRIISINSSREFDAEPPFSPELRHHPHLLTLTFDDVVREEPEDPEAPGDAVPFTRAMAKAVADFAKEAGSLPLLIHCTAGISRSGAVGEVLNWYFNRFLDDRAGDDEDFRRNNRQIIPNPLVRKILLDVLREV